MGIVRVVYKPDKSVAVIHPAPKSIFSTQGAIERIYNKQFPGLEFDDIDSSELPSREYRDAWEKEKNKDWKIDAVKKQKIDDKKAKGTIEERLTALESQ